MKLLRWHRMMGIVLVLPLLGWSVTGFVFFVKPGYADAYAMLAPRSYPFEHPVRITPGDAWTELRVVRTVLGEHLLVKSSEGRRHLRLADRTPWPAPGEESVRRLIEDAISAAPGRYGRIERIEDGVVHTDNGVRITLDWEGLSLHQRGRDTDLIDRLYDIHYLRWTGRPAIDGVVGVAGLVLVLLMAVTGCWMFFRGAPKA